MVDKFIQLQPQSSRGMDSSIHARAVCHKVVELVGANQANDGVVLIICKQMKILLPVLRFISLIIHES